MSQWHREHPDLIGTDAYPNIDQPGYVEALNEVQMIDRIRGNHTLATLEAVIADSTHVCVECGEIQGEPQDLLLQALGDEKAALLSQWQARRRDHGDRDVVTRLYRSLHSATSQAHAAHMKCRECGGPLTEREP